MKRPSSARRDRIELGSVENVQAVADGERLHIAQKGIDAHQSFGLSHLRRDAAGRFQPAFRDRSRTSRASRSRRLLSRPSAAEYSSIKRSISRKRGRRAGLDKRRRVVPDGDGGDAPLRLRRLARIVDDEGIDDRHRPQQRARRAGFRKRGRLAWQPFERAMRAEMDQRIDARLLPEPEIEGDVAHAAAAGSDRDRRPCDP